MDRVKIASELVKIAKMLSAGGWGRFSEDLTDVIEGQVLSNKRKTLDEIFRIIKANKNIVALMKEEGMSDSDLRNYLKDDYTTFVRSH